MDRQTFLEQVYEIIATASKQGTLLASQLGDLLRRALPGLDYASFGFTSLKEVLRPLKEAGRIDIKMNENGAHAISLPSGEATIGPQTPNPQSDTSQYRRLRREVWDAFICELPEGLRYINATTGSVRMALREPPDPPHEWRKVEPIGEAVQKKWATEFLKIKGCDADQELLESLRNNLWFVSFPAALRTQNQRLSADWNRIRTQRTMAHVRDWCATNNCRAELLFSSSRTTDRMATGTSSSEYSALRQAVISAVSQMPENELLELRLPLRYLVDLLPKSQTSNIYPKSTG